MRDDQETVSRRGFIRTAGVGAGAIGTLQAMSENESHAAVISPQDPRYSTVVRGFNLRWVGNPQFVFVCGTPAAVLNAVRYGVEHHLRITVRSGGHCYEDFVYGNSGGIIVDLTPLNSVYLDPSNRLYCVEAGASLWNVYNTLYRTSGVTIPGGSCYSVCAGGHVTGGGYGLLSRLHGLTVDYLHAVEIVHVRHDGEVKITVASADSSDPFYQDILWGNQGGGGGNFGIVTRFWFRDLPAAPSWALLQTLAWDWDGFTWSQFLSLVQAYGQFWEAHAQPGDPSAGLFSLLHLTQNAGQGQQIAITTQSVGTDRSLLDSYTQAITDGLPPGKALRVPVGYHNYLATGSSEIQQLPWLLATQTLNSSGPNRMFKNKSAYMIKAFPEQQIETIWKYLTEKANNNPAGLLQVDSYGAAINAIAPHTTAIPQRSSCMKLQYQIYWTDAGETQSNLDWIRAFSNDMYGPSGPLPDGTMDGCYVNYPDTDLAQWQYLYYKGNYPRLQRVKSEWDPLNVFNHKQSIEPAHL